MTIPTNYATLKTAIEEDLSRTDLTSELANFIEKGEALLNRKLRMLSMETEITTLSLVAGTDTIALPAGYLEKMTLHYNTDNYMPAHITKARLGAMRALPATTYRPLHYNVGSVIQFDANSDATYAMTMWYYKKWDIAADTTNALLTSDPDVYLYAGLVASLTKTGPHERGVEWKAALQEAIYDLNSVASRTRRDRLMSVDSALLRRGGTYNLNRGY
jgi:hypothetical protein